MIMVLRCATPDDTGVPGVPYATAGPPPPRRAAARRVPRAPVGRRQAVSARATGAPAAAVWAGAARASPVAPPRRRPAGRRGAQERPSPAATASTWRAAVTPQGCAPATPGTAASSAATAAVAAVAAAAAAGRTVPATVAPRPRSEERPGGEERRRLMLAQPEQRMARLRQSATA